MGRRCRDSINRASSPSWNTLRCATCWRPQLAQCRSFQALGLEVREWFFYELSCMASELLIQPVHCLHWPCHSVSFRATTLKAARDEAEVPALLGAKLVPLLSSFYFQALERFLPLCRLTNASFLVRRIAAAKWYKRMGGSGKAQKNAPIKSKGKHVSVATRTTISQSRKFSAAGQPAGSTSTNMLGENRYTPNPTNADPFATSLPPFPDPKQHMDNEERSSVSDTDDTALAGEKALPAPGKKTRGRVRIQMEYIQNKLRRYTTFSKRKSGMMKKVFFRRSEIYSS